MEYAWDITKLLLSCVLSFGLGLLTMALTKRKQRTEEEGKHLETMQAANNLGTLALIRKALVDSYDTYVLKKTPMTVERRHEIDQLFKAYQELGGNGTIAHLYDEITRCETEIVSPT